MRVWMALVLWAGFLPAVQAADGSDCPAGTFAVGGRPPRAFEEKCVLPDGTPQGPWRVWYPNGQLMSETPMDHGREHGELRAWWPNGQLMMRGQSIYGNRYKQFEYWDAAGQQRTVDTRVVQTVVPASQPPVPATPTKNETEASKP